MQSEKHEKMSRIIQRWEESELTQQEFCKQEQIKIATFHYWKKKLRESEESGEFFSVEMPTYVGEQIEILYPDGKRIFLPSNTPIAIVKQLLC